MNFRTKIILSILLFFSFEGITQIDTIQIYNLESGKALFLQEKGVKKVIYNRNDTSSILILSETLGDKNKIDSGTAIDGIYGVDSFNDLIGVMKRTKRHIVYSLFDISNGERKLKNVFMFSPNSKFQVQYELVDCFTVFENYLVFQENSRMIRFSEQGHIQEFNSSDKGRVPNTFYHNLMKFEK